MIHKYSTNVDKRLLESPSFSTSPLWEHAYAIEPYIRTLATLGTLPKIKPIFHSYDEEAKLKSPTLMEVNELQLAFKYGERLVTEMIPLGLPPGEKFDMQGIVIWCHFMPTGKWKTSLLDVKAGVDAGGVFLLELWEGSLRQRK